MRESLQEQDERESRSSRRVYSAPILAGTLLIVMWGLWACASGNSAPQEVMVPMRDGVRLHTRIWLPDSGGPHPVVLTRGYAPGHDGDAKRFTAAGYAYVGQSTRGHAKSEGADGVARRFFDDADDGYDALTWISEQAWCNGKIAMYGRSYWAATQWLVAPTGHPNLKAIIPQCVTPDFWQHGYWSNGALTLAMAADGRAYDNADRNEIAKLGWTNYFRHLPVNTLDDLMDGASTPGARSLWKDYVSHASFDEYWRPICMRSDGGDGKHAKIRIPVYLMAGWYDYYPGAAFKSFRLLRELSATSEIRIVVNPSDHLNRVVGKREFGRKAAKDEVALAIRWLDHVLGGSKNGIDKEPPIRIFVMGTNTWRAESEWPLARTQFTDYYFNSPDGTRHGGLSTEPPGDEAPSTYAYDPADPMPTLGGNHSCLEADIPGMAAGAVDQRPNEERDDVLVFTSDVLARDVEVTGPVTVKLFAASTAPDTDFTARLIDVQPNGVAYNLTEGILRARFRKSVWDDPEPLEPGQIYEFEIELLPTSNVFKKGHRIRVHISSSSFPLWDRNPNTGAAHGTETRLATATQTIYHDRERPSRIVLPVIPRRQR